MRILLIGGSGLIGGYLRRELENTEELFVPARREVDIRNPGVVRTAIVGFNPDAIICAAAESNVEFCEEHPGESAKTNIAGMLNLAESVDKDKVRIVWFSSEYIFYGLHGPYTETDIPNPVNEYGWQKFAMERWVSSHVRDHTIIRVTTVYGSEVKGKNFALSLIRRIKDGETVKVPCDQISTPTYALDVARATKELIKSGDSGIFNVSGPQLMSRYEFAELICREFGLPEDKISAVDTRSLMQKAKRPLNAGLIPNPKIKHLMSEPKVGLAALKRELETT